jgi:hypothetical protein
LFIRTEFDDILDCLREDDDYQKRPPQGPPTDLPTLSEEDLADLKGELSGKQLQESTGLQRYAYKTIEPLTEGDLKLKELTFPCKEDLKYVNICGIDGSNQKVERGLFYFILARSAFVNFKYSTDGSKPYAQEKTRDFSAMVQVDGNIFNENLTNSCQTAPATSDISLLPIVEGSNQKPLRVAYDPSKSDKNPKSHALGWAVKLQQALELAAIEDVDYQSGKDTICIRDGPLFSTSVTPVDVIDGLKKTKKWNKNQVLISSSKRVSESTLLVEALLNPAGKSLRDYWFQGQNIIDATLKTVATDMLLLPKILKPGHRTPLMAAVPRARSAVVDKDPDLTPLVCYYYSRTRPHTFIRLEVPKFMWERDKEMVNRGLQITAWQHELGRKAPLVQIFADKFSQLYSEKLILERKTNRKLKERRLTLPEEYE